MDRADEPNPMGAQWQQMAENIIAEMTPQPPTTTGLPRVQPVPPDHHRPHQAPEDGWAPEWLDEAGIAVGIAAIVGFGAFGYR